MFTGIIEAIGRVAAVETRGGDRRLTIACDLAGGAFVLGESIAVSGACLTVVDFDERSFAADVSQETLGCTTLGEFAQGTAVNLERAMRVGDRLGGHWVSGHVDAVGVVSDLRPDARSTRMTIDLPETIARYVAPKGSICVDGVSLTVNGATPDQFDVNVIPHTQAVTTLAQWQAGTRVNLEADVVARYLDRQRAFDAPEPQSGS